VCVFVLAVNFNGTAVNAKKNETAKHLFPVVDDVAQPIIRVENSTVRRLKVMYDDGRAVEWRLALHPAYTQTRRHVYRSILSQQYSVMRIAEPSAIASEPQAWNKHENIVDH